MSLHEQKQKPQHAAKRRGRPAAVFFVLLAVLTVVAFLIPLRPTRSYSEKRSLTPFPAFSFVALASGDYFDGIGAWFSDTFPGREAWLRAAAVEEQLHGISDVTFHGELPAETVRVTVPPVPTPPPATATPAPTATPTATPAPTATPEPTPTPAPTPEPVVETSPPTESVEEWGGIVVDADAEVIFSNNIQIGDAVYGYFTFLQDGCDAYARVLSDFADAMAEKGVEVYAMPIPTSAGVMISSEYQEKIRCSDQGASIAYMLGMMGDNVKKVNVFNNLVAHNDEYIYFRTDHHWTALGAYYAYETLCAAAGTQAAPLEDFTLIDMGDFKGTFYYESKQNWRLKIDTLYGYVPPGDLEMKITQEGGNTFVYDVVADLSRAKPGTKYLAFIGGDNPMTVIENRDKPDAPVCVVIKDSFGNPFVPYLTQNYSKVYVLDYRSYTKMKLKQFVDAYGVDQVIFAQALPLAESQGTIGLTRSLCR